MMYNPDHFDEGPIDPKSGFPSITPKLGFPGQFNPPMQTPMPGFGGGRMSNPLGSLQFALMNLANQDSQQSNNQKVIDTMSGITSLVNEAFPSFSQKYGGGIGTGMGSGGMGPGMVEGPSISYYDGQLGKWIKRGGAPMPNPWPGGLPTGDQLEGIGAFHKSLGSNINNLTSAPKTLPGLSGILGMLQ